MAERVPRHVGGSSVVYQDEPRAATVTLHRSRVLDVLRVGHGFCRVPVSVNSAQRFPRKYAALSYSDIIVSAV